MTLLRILVLVGFLWTSPGFAEWPFIWDTTDAATRCSLRVLMGTAIFWWWMPMCQGDGFVLVGFSAGGNALPDWTWTPPNGVGGASSVRRRPDGGFVVAGNSDGGGDPPGWWIVATDAAGKEAWSHFEDGDTGAGIFSGAFLLEAQGDVEGAVGETVLAWADDETLCGVFSLRLWALDTATGDEQWATTWPPSGGCSSFTPPDRSDRPQEPKATRIESAAT